MGKVEPILNDSYEVIVVGAGVGGLTAAALLVKSGLDVLVLEKNHVPGGCCTSFRRGDFTFDAMATNFTGFGDSGFNAPRAVIDYLEQDMEIVDRESSHRVYFEDATVEVHRDLDRYLVELGSVFPHQMGGIYSFFRFLQRLYKSALAAMTNYTTLEHASPGQRLLFPLRAHYHLSRILPGSHNTLGRYFRHYLDDPGLRHYLDTELQVLMGATLEQAPALQGAVALMDRHYEGTCYLLGSSLSLPSTLEKSIIENGGRVVYHTEVDRILAQDGKAKGVRLRGGRDIEAEIVISNLSLSSLSTHLLATDQLSNRTREWLGKLAPRTSAVCVYVGVEDSIIPPELHPKSITIPGDNSDKGYTEINVPSKDDHNLAPPGHHCLSIITPVTPGSWPQPEGPGANSREYQERKIIEAGRMVEQAEKIIPGLGGAIRHMEVATPTTIERYTGRTFGSLRSSPLSHREYRGLKGCVTEIRGLLAIDDSEFWSSGVCSATFSGISCANQVLRRQGRKSLELGKAEKSYVLEMIPAPVHELARNEIIDTISAVQEARRCMRCRDAPCIENCPAGVDVLTFIRRILTRNLEGAAKTIRQQALWGEVCGLLCPTENLCERGCSRRLIDKSVRIGKLQSYVCRSAQDPQSWPSPADGARKAPVAVIGAGPTGMSAAFFLSLQGHSVELLEEQPGAGGMPVSIIPENWLDQSAPHREIQGAITTGIEYRGNTALGTDVTLESLREEGFGAVLLSMGLTSSRRLNIPGGKLPETMGALEFLRSAKELEGRKIPSRVAVVGRDNLALAAACVASELGARSVVLISPTSKKGTGDREDHLAKARERSVRFYFSSYPTKITGDTKVVGIEILTEGGSSHKDVTGNLKPTTIETDMVIVSVGRELSRGIRKYLEGRLALTEDGRVKVNPETMMTSVPGVFAGGELVSGPALIVEVTAQGRRAALSIDRYLRGEELTPPS